MRKPHVPSKYELAIMRIRQGRLDRMAKLRQIALENPEALRRGGLSPERVLAITSQPEPPLIFDDDDSDEDED